MGDNGITDQQTQERRGKLTYRVIILVRTDNPLPTGFHKPFAEYFEAAEFMQQTVEFVSRHGGWPVGARRSAQVDPPGPTSPGRITPVSLIKIENSEGRVFRQWVPGGDGDVETRVC